MELHKELDELSNKTNFAGEKKSNINFDQNQLGFIRKVSFLPWLKLNMFFSTAHHVASFHRKVVGIFIYL